MCYLLERCHKFLPDASRNEKYDGLFNREAFDLYRKYLEEMILNENGGRLQTSFCRNYINLCRKMVEAGHINGFLNKYRHIFPAEYKEDLINICKAVHFFEKQNFQESLKHIPMVSIDKDIFKIDVKILPHEKFL